MVNTEINKTNSIQLVDNIEESISVQEGHDGPRVAHLSLPDCDLVFDPR